MNKTLCFILIITSSLAAKMSVAQEINATVNVLSPNVQMTNKEVFTTLETSIRNFVNSYTWSSLNYEEEERIDCSFILTVNSYSGNNFSGTMQVQYSRPIYNSDYNSPVLNFIDKEMQFSYIINAPLEYQPNSHISNLTSMLAYYCNFIIGLDQSTMVMGGGDEFFKQMQTIISNAQSSSSSGWRSFDGNKSRYWLSDNLNSPAFDPIKNGLYQYHRNGLDKMYEVEQQQLAKTTIRDVIISFEDIYQKRPNALLLNSFFDAKSDEIVSIFSDGPEIDINKLISTLKLIDAGRTNKYETISDK